MGYLRVYAHILGSLYRGLEIKVFKVKAYKAHIATRKDTVNDESEEVEVTCGHAYIDWVADLDTRDGDACPIGILLLRFDLTYNHGVADLFSSVLMDIFKSNYAEGVCALHSLVLGSF